MKRMILILKILYWIILSIILSTAVIYIAVMLFSMFVKM